MFSFLTNLEINLATNVVCLILGMVFKTKITDFFKGIPAQARVALNQVEADTASKLRGAQAQVINSLPGAPPAPKAALAPGASPPAAPAV
jgi:hypothetical protein